ncbi:MAG: hypothetical protein GWP08_17880 [Nitrospiraceae bacterium]|nr:hypothetical protein [Nitrospiraceae bacterium]
MSNPTFWISLLPIALVFTASCAASAASDGAALAPEQEQALNALAREQAFSWPEITPGQAQALHAKAQAYWDLYERYHLPHGLNADIWWHDYDRTSVYRLEGVGDSAAWTGHYLAALALRYHLEPDGKLLERINAVLDKYDLLSVISGREGYLARYAGPASDAGYRGYYEVYGRGEDPERPGLGKKAYKGVPPYEDLVWLGHSSRDTYDGVNFGLATTLAYVDDAAVRTRIGRLVERVADRLIADGWNIVDGKGNVTRGNPWFNMAWMRTMLTVNPKKYAKLESGYTELCRKLHERKKLVYDIRFREYFANNLRFIRLFSTCALETDAERKRLLREVASRMQAQSAAHLNAHFAAICTLITGDKDNRDARAAVQGLLIDFPQPPKFGHAVDLRGREDFEFVSDEYTQYAQLPRDRVPTDFMWQRSPCVSHGCWDLPYELPGMDVFLPYWMGRVAGIIPAP